MIIVLTHLNNVFCCLCGFVHEFMVIDVFLKLCFCAAGNWKSNMVIKSEFKSAETIIVSPGLPIINKLYYWRNTRNNTLFTAAHKYQVHLSTTITYLNKQVHQWQPNNTLLVWKSLLYGQFINTYAYHILIPATLYTYN